MPQDIVRTFALRFKAFPRIWAITEHVVRLETEETEFFLRGKLLSMVLFLEDLGTGCKNSAGSFCLEKLLGF